MPNQATSDAKKTMSPTPAAQAHSCSTSWALRPTPSSNLGCHGSWNHWPWESWWCCYMLISAVCLPCAARCSICIILPQAYPILWTIFLYLLVVPPEKRGYWVLLFSRINVTSVRPSGSQHGNVHHKLQYISAHLGPLFRTYDLKLSRSHQWRPTTSGCSVGHRCGSTSIPCLQIEKGWEGVDLKTFRIWRPSFETNEVHMGPESKHVQTHGIHWNPILFTRKSLGFMDVHPLNNRLAHLTHSHMSFMADALMLSISVRSSAETMEVSFPAMPLYQFIQPGASDLCGSHKFVRWLPGSFLQSRTYRLM